MPIDIWCPAMARRIEGQFRNFWQVIPALWDLLWKHLLHTSSCIRIPRALSLQGDCEGLDLDEDGGRRQQRLAQSCADL